MIIRALVLGVLCTAVGLAGLARAAPQDASACARGYSPCLPVKQDLDCGQIPDTTKPVRVTGQDPYGLDADRDGLGCEVSGEGGGRQSPWGLILRKPPRKEATSAKVGDTLTVVGWSPGSFKGSLDWQLCVGPGCSEAVIVNATLKGTVQTFATVKVRRALVSRGVFKVSLMVDKRVRAFDTVPVR